MTALFMEIVPLREAPVRHLRGLTLLAHVRTGGDGERAIVASGMQALLNRAERTEAYAVLGRVSHVLIGWAALEVAQEPWPDPDMFISVYVHPDFRRQGHGTALVESALAFTHDLFPELTPCCIPFDDAGFQTFRKAGFSFHPDRQVQRLA